MDTERVVPWMDESAFSPYNIVDLDSNSEKIVLDFIEITRYIQEINQIYKIFQYNLQNILRVYTLDTQNSIKRNCPHFKDFSDQIEINALIISYISAGKTLVDALESCVRTFDNKKGLLEHFKKFSSQIYDSNFNYRFLSQMRHFSQHGHLPVSLYSDTFCFDLAQIKNTPHFSHKAALKQELESASQELLEVYESVPAYAFTLCIAEYTTCIAKIYSKFWSIINRVFKKYVSEFNKLIDTHPDFCSINKEDGTSSLFFYSTKDNYEHFIDLSDSPLEMFKEFTKESRIFLAEENSELKKLKSSTLFLRLTKGQNNSSTDSISILTGEEGKEE